MYNIFRMIPCKYACLQHFSLIAGLFFLNNTKNPDTVRRINQGLFLLPIFSIKLMFCVFLAITLKSYLQIFEILIGIQWIVESTSCASCSTLSICAPDWIPLESKRFDFLKYVFPISSRKVGKKTIDVILIYMFSCLLRLDWGAAYFLSFSSICDRGKAVRNVNLLQSTPMIRVLYFLFKNYPLKVTEK